MSEQVERLEAWRRLADSSSRSLVRDVAAIDLPADAAAIARLRRHWPAPLVAAALDLTTARRRARGRFPNAETLIADPAGVEQASGHVIAEHKACRFAGAGVGRILDLCCGIGGDAMSLARCADVTAIDVDPLRIFMCECNAGCATTVADVTTMPIDAAFHLDPQRRDGTRRRWRYEEYMPGPAFIDRLVRLGVAGAIKLGPGVDPDALSAVGATELEFISDDGVLRQCVQWTGPLARYAGWRTATRLPDGQTLSGIPGPPPATPGGAFENYVHVADPAAERAGLLGALCAAVSCTAPHPPLGLLTSADDPRSPWLQTFRIVASLRWRPREVRRWLAANDGGIVEVKTRGHVVDPDRVQLDLRGDGSTTHTLFVIRMGHRRLALVTRRSAATSAG